MKQPFLRDCPWGLDYKLRDLSGFFYAMIERVDVPASVACPHARIRVGSIRHLRTISYGGQGVDGRGT
jgi:hypothetical protein